MDFFTHFIVGWIVGNVLSLSLANLLLLIVGSMLPDLCVLPVLLLCGGKKSLEPFAVTGKKEPAILFEAYDFFHSFTFMAVLFLFSFVHKGVIVLLYGMILHLILDVPFHKKHSLRPFFPLKYRISGFFDWYIVFKKRRWRIIIWIILIVILFLTMK